MDKFEIRIFLFFLFIKHKLLKKCVLANSLLHKTA